MFRVEPQPALLPLPIRTTPPSVGDPVVLIGAGRGRGARFDWNGRAGWLWGPQPALRWGTNRVSATGVDVRAANTVTRSFAVRFDAGGTRHEAQAAIGDSGGAALIRREGRFELAGVLFAVSSFSDQPPETALYENLTHAADLSFYRPTLAALLHER